MANIELKQKLNIFIVGAIAAFLFLLMFYVLFAQILVDFVIGELENISVLFMIVLGLLLITFFVSIMVGFFIVKNIAQSSILKASIMSIILTFFLLMIISYTSLFILYPEIFRELDGIELIIVFPQVILYFGVYVFNEIYILFIFIIMIYFILFVMFLELFYKYAPKKYVRKTNYKW